MNSKILSMSWTNDGLHIALGLFSGHISIRDKFGEALEPFRRPLLGQEKADVVRSAPIWTLAWNPVQTKQDPTDVLVVGCWDQTLSFYKASGALRRFRGRWQVSGQQYGTERGCPVHLLKNCHGFKSKAPAGVRRLQHRLLLQLLGAPLNASVSTCFDS